MSLPIDEIITILRDGGHLTDPKALQAAAKDLLSAERELKESKADATPAAKTRLVALVRIDGEVHVGGAYIVSVPDEADATSNTYSGEALLNRLRAAAVEHNESPRPRRGKGKTKVDTWQTLFANLKAKTLKASGSAIGIKQKGAPAEIVVLSSETLAPQ